MSAIRRMGLALSIGFCAMPFMLAQPQQSGTRVSHVSPAADGSARRVLEEYGRLPLSFIPNHGQTDSNVRFQAGAAGLDVFLTGDEVVLALREALVAKPVRADVGVPRDTMQPLPSRGIAVRLKLVGAQSNVRIEGLEDRPGRFNYINGSDPSGWQTDISAYRKVAYHGVYPGVDVIYYGNAGSLEHDFLLAPGADPKRVQWQISGADSLKLTPAGNLEIRTALGTIVLHAPVAYQPSQEGRRSVAAKLVVIGKDRVAFDLGNYDPARELVIDPYLSYATYLGGSASGSYTTGIVLDANHNAYISGSTSDLTYPTTAGSYSTGTDGCSTRGFVSKLNASGTALVYSTFIRGTCAFQASTYPIAIALDGNGDAYIAGYTTDPTYPTTGGAYQSALPGSFGTNTNNANSAGFVTELNSSGSGLVFSTFLSGSSVIGCNGCGLSLNPQSLALDSTGIYLTGSTNEGDFPTTPGAFQSTKPTADSGQTAFITKMSLNGVSLPYSSYLGGLSSGDESSGYHITASNGNAYATGIAYSGTSDFPTTPGAYQTTQPGDWSTFVTELNASGSALVASTYFSGSTTLSFCGGTPYAIPSAGIAVDSSGNVTIAGYTDSNNLPTTSGVLAPNYGAKQNCYNSAFATRFNPSLSGLVYSTYITANENDQEYAQALRLDSAGNAYVTGEAYSSGNLSTFPFVNAIDASYPQQNTGIVFVTALNSIGAGIYNTFFIGSTGSAIAVDSAGAAYVAADGVGVPTTPGAYQSSGSGQFIFKISPADQPAAVFSSPSVTFPPTLVGQTSQATSLTLYNFGSAALNISSPVASPGFSETDSCGGVVGAAGSCLLSLTFSPVATGTQTGTLTLTDNAAGSPQSLALNGLGRASAVGLSTRAVTFAPQQVGTSSAAQSVALDSVGNVDLHITGIRTSAPFSVSNNCATDMPEGSSCTLKIVFAPSAAGNTLGSVTVSDDALDSPQVIALTGSSYSTSVTVAPASLNFANQVVGIVSTAQPVTIQNTGSATLNLRSVTANGDFSAVSTCGATLAAGASCAANVTFTPSQAGARTGTLTVADDGLGAPQTVALAGVGLAPAASLSTGSLSFAAQSVGSTSNMQAVMLSNSGSVALTIREISATGDFAQSNNCGGSVSAGSSCTINVTFTPSAPGARDGALTVGSNAPGGPQTVSLSGNGVDYTVRAAPGSATLTAGGSTTSTVTVAAVGGTFGGTVSLSCLGLPAQATCSFNPVTVTPGATSQTSTLTITTAAAKTIGLNSTRGSAAPVLALWLHLSGPTGLGLIGAIFVIPTERKRRWHLRAVLCLLMLALVTLSVACGSGNSTSTSTTTAPGTPTGTYTVTVLGTSGTVQQVSSFTVTVQ
ncbi:MAG: choice-of-anchor D domain-containing protein [Candidatus Sulfotelmatobacter sp.]